MKIRIKGNSIRYRLTKSEVETFSKTGYFEGTTDFGDTKFVYALKAKEGIALMEADFTGGTITLYLEKDKSKDWFANDQVGFQHIYKGKNDSEIALLLEKDFVCMDKTVEDQSDNYPNPKLIR